MIRTLVVRTQNARKQQTLSPFSSLSRSSFRNKVSAGSDYVSSNDEIGSSIRRPMVHPRVGLITRNNITLESRLRFSSHPLPVTIESSSLVPSQSSSRIQNRWTTKTKIQNFRQMSTYNATASAFVSRHNHSINVTPEEILDYCAKHNGNAFIEAARTTNTHVVFRECCFCTKPTRNEASNLYKLHVLIGGGAFFCHRCGTGGSWYDLKAKIGGFNVDRGMSNSNTFSNQNYNNNHQCRSLGSGGANNNNSWNYSNYRQQQQSSTNLNDTGVTETCLPMPPTRLSGLYSSRLLDDLRKTNGNVGIQDQSSDAKKSDSDKNGPLQYLREVRGLNTKTLRKYGVGRAAYRFPSDKKGGGYQEAECITFPWIMRESDVRTQEAMRGATFELNGNSNDSSSKTTASENKDDVNGISKNEKDISIHADAPTGPFVTRRIKARALERKSWQRLDPPGGGWGLFGLHTVPDDCNTLILTEGEYDAMAVHQATGMPAVSLPNGCRSLPLQVLPLLERFDKIILWMDSDEPGREGAEKFAKKLGVNRTYIVHCLEAKDANDALLKGDIDMKACIDEATLLPHDRIITFGDLRNDVLKELLEPDLYSGTAVPSLPRFTQLIKGFRRGEMTVLTGPTGCGKTTFLGQVSLDLAEQGENVLWGSFEIKNTRLLHKLMKQFSRDSLPVSTDKNARENFEVLADRFEDLPLYFMKFHGGSDVDEVLDAMEYAVYVNDVEHIILDNMQFMITRHSQKSAWDKFEVQDIAIEKFRKFATEHNVHVTLVVHPRKEDETSKLSISSFFGSAKATQEADTVIIIQNDANRRKYLDVKKNRFDGTLGYSPIYFQSKSGRYVEDEGSAGNSTTQARQNHSYKSSSPNTNTNSLEPKAVDSHWEKILSPPPSSSRA